VWSRPNSPHRGASPSPMLPASLPSFLSSAFRCRVARLPFCGRFARRSLLRGLSSGGVTGAQP
jgi:hypothetical protein